MKDKKSKEIECSCIDDRNVTERYCCEECEDNFKACLNCRLVVRGCKCGACPTKSLLLGIETPNLKFYDVQL